MGVAEEVLERLAKAAPTLLDLLRRRFIIPDFSEIELIRLVPGLVSSNNLFDNPEDKAEKLTRALSSLVGEEVTAPVMMYYSGLVETMVPASGVITDVRVLQGKLYISVRLKEPVEWRDREKTVREAYALTLGRLDTPLYEAAGFVLLLALNRHIEEKVLTALESVGLNTERLREAVRLARGACNAWFSNT